MSEKYWYLKQCRLFEHLSPRELERVESQSRSRVFSRKSPIYLPADAADGVLLLATGQVKICSLTAEGKQSILAFIDPGELFGELAILSADQREEYAEAIEESKVILIPAGEMKRLVSEHSRVSHGITKLIGLRRKRIERRLKYLLFHSNRERLVHLLLELAEQYGRSSEQGIELGIKLSHQDLANIIGSTRETVTVTLGDLQNDRLVSVGRRKIVIANLDSLAASISAPVPKIPEPSATEQTPNPAVSRKAANPSY
jgi:CRP-like cAMP-binding protein